jgi:zinc/manganese transport system substrate-binding protein
MRRLIRFVALACAGLVFAAAHLRAEERLNVVASFTILADMTRQVGGEHVTVTALVGPNGDAHSFNPNPSDAKTVAQAKLVIANGLGFDNWINRLTKSVGYKGPMLLASKGVKTRKAEQADEHASDHKEGGHDHDATDPHAWQDLANARRYVANIADALAKADPAHAADYKARADAYDRDLAALDADIRSQLSAIPRDKRKIITSHDAFGYFGRAYGIDFLSPVGLSTESEPSAKDLAALIRQMKRQNVRVLFIETMSDPRLVQQLAREGGGIVGGQVYSDSLSDRDGPAPTYTEMFRHNVKEFVSALKQASS